MVSDKTMQHLVASPCCVPQMDLDAVLSGYAELGFRKFEVFTEWAHSTFNIDGDPEFYLAKGKEYGLTFPSCHLTPVTDDYDASLERALQAARFAKAIGSEIVLYKASSKDNYIKAAPAILDLTEELGLTAVLQHHYGSPLHSLDDMAEVRLGISDLRMRTMLEVGHLHAAGHRWEESLEALAESISLVHIKDMIGTQSVPFGTGEVNLPGLFAALRERGYTGNVVIEMEVEDRENTMRYIAAGLEFIEQECGGGLA